MSRNGSIVSWPCRFLLLNDRLTPVDLIFVLAGRPERKPYGLELFRQGLAPQIVLSVGRFETRQIGALGFKTEPDLIPLAKATPPENRHFFVHITTGAARAVVCPKAKGTHSEMACLAGYLNDSSLHSIAMVSTSIHLRRVRWCCDRQDSFRGKKILYWPVPEERSSFRCRGWWCRSDHWTFLVKEYAKLCGYRFRYRGADRFMGSRAVPR